MQVGPPNVAATCMYVCMYMTCRRHARGLLAHATITNPHTAVRSAPTSYQVVYSLHVLIYYAAAPPLHVRIYLHTLVHILLSMHALHACSALQSAHRPHAAGLVVCSRPRAHSLRPSAAAAGRSSLGRALRRGQPRAGRSDPKMKRVETVGNLSHRCGAYHEKAGDHLRRGGGGVIVGAGTRGAQISHDRRDLASASNFSTESGRDRGHSERVGMDHAR
jgi:hypothetical protein